MKIKTEICEGQRKLEEFLNNKLDYKGFRPESIILGISQYRMYYTVIYKDLNSDE